MSTFCDRIALLHKGYIEQVAPPTEFYSKQQLLETCGASAGDLARISWQTGLHDKNSVPLSLQEAETAFAPSLARLDWNQTINASEQPSMAASSEVVAEVQEIW